jgi:hypothetical protein
MTDQNKQLLLNKLNSEFSSTSKILFGLSLENIFDYEPWLLEQKEPTYSTVSSISNESVPLPCKDYSKKAKFANLDEISKLKDIKLNINQIKDLDGIHQALVDQLVYCGGIHLGNCSSVLDSSDISDSHYIYKSARIHKSEFISHSTILRHQKYMFGSSVGTFSNYGIRCHQFSNCNRVFELCFGSRTSDCYYSYYMQGCSDCMFSFNQKNARFCIGNLALEKEKYLSIKKSLLEQMHSELVSKKCLPKLTDILVSCSSERSLISNDLKEFSEKYLEDDSGKQAAGKYFSSTSKVLLGTEFKTKDIDTYSDWLENHTYKISKKKSVLGSGLVASTTYQNHIMIPNGCIVNINEAHKLAKLKIDASFIENLNFSNIPSVICKVSFVSPQFVEGENTNVTDCPIMLSCSNSYKVHGAVWEKDSAYSTWPNGSECVFGSAFAVECKYCINCYNSFNLTRCFECDCCRSCEDCYYSHNLENCQNCMFCFNAKNLRYAIGNQEISKDKYLELKSKILSEIVQKLQKDKKISLDIYNLGSV